jgi:tetratricopeptide (TPR) repeat protein
MDVIKVEQAADYLQCAVSKIYRLIHSNQLNAQKVNRYWFICQRSLRTFWFDDLKEQALEHLEKQNYHGAQRIYLLLAKHFPQQLDGWYGLGQTALAAGDQKEALKYLRKCLKEFPEYAPAHQALAQIYYSRESFTKALQHYQYLYEKAPEDLQVIYNLGLTLGALQRNGEAHLYFRRAIALDPGYSKPYYALGFSYYSQGSHAKALEYYQAALAMEPDNAHYMTSIGITLSAQKQYTQAIDWFEKALRVAPDQVDIYYSLALAYEDQGQIAKAIETYRNHLKYYPYCEDAWFNLGALYMRSQKPEEACRCLLKNLDLAPENSLAHNHLGLVLTSLKQYEKALPHYKKAHAYVLPDTPELQAEIYHNQALTFHAMKDYEQALAACEKALALSPTMEKALQIQAHIYFEKGDAKAAIQAYQTLLSQGSGSEKTYYYLGLAYHQNNQLEEASRAYLAALEQKPDYYQVYNALGYAYQNRKEYLKAIKFYYRALALAPDYTRAMYNLALVFTEQRDFAQALKWYQRTLKTDPEHVEAYINLGFTYDNLNELHKAIDCYRTALQKTDQTPSLYVILGLAYSRARQLEEAIATYRTALQKLPQEASELHYLIGLAYLSNQACSQQAIAAFEEAIAQAPDQSYSDASMHLGNLYLNRKEIDKAIFCYRKVIAADLQAAHAYVSLANAYHLKGETDKSHKYARMAMKIQPEDPEIIYQAALIYYRQDRWRHALDLFQSVIALQPNHAGAHNYTGSIFRSLGYHAKAMQAFETALKIDPHYCVAYLNLSYTCFDLGNLPEALRYCQQSIVCEPECPNTYYWLGHLYYTQEDWQQAIAAFEKVLEKDPSHEESLKWLPLAKKHWIRKRNTGPLSLKVGGLRSF